MNIDITDRKRAEEALRESEARYRALAESTRDIIFILDRQGALLYANQAASQCIGIPSVEIVGKRQVDLFPPEMVRSQIEKTERVFGTGEVIEYDDLFHFGPAEVWLRIHLIPLQDEAGQITSVMGVCHNITDRKRAEQALQKAHDELERRVEERTAELAKANERLEQAHKELRSIYDGMPDGVLVADIETKQFVRCNAGMRHMLSFTEDELLARSIIDIHPADELPSVLETFHALVVDKQRIGHNIPMLRKDGSVFHADVTHNEIELNGRRCTVGFFRDITERKQAQEALERERQSLWRMLQASDHERQIISYDIHDGLAQYLAAAGMQFQVHDALRENSPDEAKRAYETAVELVRQSHSESRRLINAVRPPVIDENGIEMAISHLVHEQRRHGGPTIDCHTNVQFKRLPSILENAIYRIVQEALTNACKHGKATKVAVSLTQEGQDVRLEVRDWGIGFDPESVEKGHFGLEGIRQRVRLLGGRLTIESTPGSGTLVQVVVPIVEKQEEE